MVGDLSLSHMGMMPSKKYIHSNI